MFNNNVYKQIVKNSKSAYFFANTVLDKHNNIIDCKIIDTNKTFDNLLNNFLRNSLNASIDIVFDSTFNWIDIIKSAMLNDTFTKVDYIDIFNGWFEITVQKVDDSSFYILLDETHKINDYTQKLLDVLPYAVWYKDINGRYITSSKYMLNNKRVKSIDIVGKTDLDIQNCLATAKSVIKHDTTIIKEQSFDKYNSILDQNTIHEVQKHCVLDNDGNTIGTLGFYLDVSAHINLKKKYQEHKQLSYSLLHSIKDMLTFRDLDGVYKYCNKSFLDFLNLNKIDDVIGKKDDELFNYDYNKLKFIEYTHDKIIKNKLPLRHDAPLSINGEMRYFDVIKTPLVDENNNVLGVIGVTRDVTEQKEIENKIKKNQEQLISILNGIQDAIILSDKENILYVNNAFENIFGVKNDGLIKNPALLLELCEDDYKSFLSNYDYDKIYNLEFKIRTNDNKIKWICYKDSYIDKDKSQKITVIRDITSKKEYTLELDRLKTEFFSNITHELRTPLNLIFSSLQLIDLKIDSNDIKVNDYKRYAKIVRQNSLRLLKLVNNLIDSTKLESSYLTCNCNNIDIVYFTEEIFNSIEPYARVKNINLIFDTNVEEKHTYFDVDKLERIILNLLSNAIKFNKENGSIYLTINAKDNYTQISVKDTGIGMPNDKIDSIFDRFVQVNNRMTKISEGSGIGLSLTKSLIDNLGGNIKVISKLNEGSEFIVTLFDQSLDDNCNKPNQSNQYNEFVSKLEIEFSDIY